MASELFANNAATTLSGNGGSITNVATTLIVASATQFPATGNFRIIIGSEIMIVTGVSGTTFTVTRGAEGTSNVTHNDGDAVTHILTAGSIAALLSVMTPQGRLTLTSGTPEMTSSVTGATTIYYTPAVGDWVKIYDGASWGVYSFSELSQLTTDTTKSPAACIANTNYDMFVWNDSGTIRCTRGPAWTIAQTFTVTIASPAVFSLTGHGFYDGMPLVFSTTGALPTGLTAGTTYYVIAAGLTANAFEVATAPGGAAVNTSGTQSGTHTVTQGCTVRGTGAGTTELTRQNGVLVNANAITNGPAAKKGTYVGTIHTNSSSQVDVILGGSGVDGGESTSLGIWNNYNRVPITLMNYDSTNSWTYNSTTVRMKNAGATGNGYNNRIHQVIAWQRDSWNATNSVTMSNASTGGGAVTAVTVNSSSSYPTSGFTVGQQQGTSGHAITATSHYVGIPPLGYNYVAPIESTFTNTETFFGDSGGANHYSSIMLATQY